MRTRTQTRTHTHTRSKTHTHTHTHTRYNYIGKVSSTKRKPLFRFGLATAYAAVPGIGKWKFSSSRTSLDVAYGHLAVSSYCAGRSWARMFGGKIYTIPGTIKQGYLIKSPPLEKRGLKVIKVSWTRKRSPLSILVSSAQCTELQHLVVVVVFPMVLGVMGTGMCRTLVGSYLDGWCKWGRTTTVCMITVPLV